MLAYQRSLLDVDEAPGLRPLGPAVERTELEGGAWLDLRRDWVTGGDAVFEALLSGVPWRAERRPMYDRVVDVPAPGSESRMRRIVPWGSMT